MRWGWHERRDLVWSGGEGGFGVMGFGMNGGICYGVGVGGFGKVGFGMKGGICY